MHFCPFQPTDFQSKKIATYLRAERIWRREVPVTSTSPCGLRCGSIASRHEEDQLQLIPVPARDHPAGRLALPQILIELPRRRRLAGPMRDHGFRRDDSALDEPFRAVDAEGEVLGAPLARLFEAPEGGEPPRDAKKERKRNHQTNQRGDA